MLLLQRYWFNKPAYRHGGHYWSYRTDTNSFNQIMTTHSKILYLCISSKILHLLMSCIGLTGIRGYRDISSRNGQQATCFMYMPTLNYLTKYKDAVYEILCICSRCYCALVWSLGLIFPLIICSLFHHVYHWFHHWFDHSLYHRF